MVNEGETTAGWVDTQDVSLTNMTDDKTYVQLQNVNINISKNVEKNELTDDTIHNIFSLFMNSISGNVILTTQEIFDWIELVKSNVKKEWRISFTDSSDRTKNIEFWGQLSSCNLIDDGVGDATYFFNLECDERVTI